MKAPRVAIAPGAANGSTRITSGVSAMIVNSSWSCSAITGRPPTCRHSTASSSTIRYSGGFGRYLQNPAPGEMTIMRMTTAPCVAWVEYGPTAQLGQKAHPDIDGLRRSRLTA